MRDTHHAPRRPRRPFAPSLALLVLLTAVSACGDEQPTEPVPLLASRYRLVAAGPWMVPTILDTTAQGERLITSGSLAFGGSTAGDGRPSVAVRSFTFQSTEEENGVPRWIEGVEAMTGVRQSGRYIIFSIGTPGGEAPSATLDSAIIDDNGKLILRAALYGVDPTGRRHNLLFEPDPETAQSGN